MTASPIRACISIPGFSLHRSPAILVVAAWLSAACAVADEPLEVAAVLQHREAFSRPHDIEVQGALAFVAGKGGSVAIVDIADPRAPKLLWWKHDPQELEDAQTVLPLPGALLLGARDVFALEISNPVQPKWTGKAADRSRVDRINGMARRGDYVFTANKSGWVGVIDIRKPQSPAVHDSLHTRERGELQSPHDIAAWDDYIAVVSQSGNSTIKFRVYRVADAKTHELLPCEQWHVCGGIDRDDLLGANRVMVSNGYAYVACSQRENFQLGVIDVRDAEYPRHVATIAFAGKYPTGLTVAGRMLFAAGGKTIQALDVSNPEKPKTLAVLHSEKLFPTERDNAHDLVYANGHLFVTAQNDDQIAMIKVVDERIRALADLESP